MDADELHPAPRAAQPPPGAAVLRNYLRLPARQARALLPPSAGDAPMEGGILGVLFSAALRRARDAPPLHGVAIDGGVHLALPARADGDEVAHGLLLREALAKVRAHPPPVIERLLFNALLHRARRHTSPPAGPYLLRLPVHQARRLLPPPPPARLQSAEAGLHAFLLYAGLRRLEATIAAGSDGPLMDFVTAIRPLSRGLVPSPREGDHATILVAPASRGLLIPGAGAGSALVAPASRGLLIPGADDDGVLLVLRMALPIFRAGAERPLNAAARRYELLLIISLLHRARRLAPPPSAMSVLHVFLRLPAHQARHLLPPPVEPARLRSSGLVPLLLFMGLRGRVHGQYKIVMLLLLCLVLPRLSAKMGGEEKPAGTQA